jgi:hypothetical protein
MQISNEPSPAVVAVPSAIDVVEWTIHVDVAFTSMAGTHYHADVYRQGEWLCRIAMSGAASNKPEAERALAEKCRDWIASFEDRERSGDTAFQVI